MYVNYKRNSGNFVVKSPCRGNFLHLIMEFFNTFFKRLENMFTEYIYAQLTVKCTALINKTITK